MSIGAYTGVDWDAMMAKADFNSDIIEMKAVLECIIHGREIPEAFDYSSIYVSKEAMEDMRKWKV